jgi:hypothetical protein
MNVYTKKLNQIRVALGMAVKMVTAKLEDGVTVVETEALEPGNKIYVVSEDGEKAPAPEGIHVTEDGVKVTVDAEGTIASVELPESKEEEFQEEENEEKVKIEEETYKRLRKKFEEEAPSIIEEIIEEKIEGIIEEKFKSYKMNVEEEVADLIEAIVEDVAEIKEEMAKYKTKLSKTPADKKISTFNSEAKPDKFDAVEARIEALKNIRAGKI